MLLIGHPTGNPNSHHAALAHLEAGRLAGFVTPWFPGRFELAVLGAVPGLRPTVDRLARRRFEPLAGAPKFQGRRGEWRRLWRRWRGTGDEGLAYEANDWLMRAMQRECRRPEVAAVHSYEDCSLWQFDEAKRLGKACIYDMPIGDYAAWEQTQSELVRKFAGWLPSGGLPSNRWVRPEQKRREMELADLVLVPRTFVKETVLRFHPAKKLALAPYGVDLEFWKPSPPSADFHIARSGPLRFLYAGQISIRKGIPVLMEAWQQAGLKDATLQLVGSWRFDDSKKRELPPGVTVTGPLPREQLRDRFRNADVFVLPSFFEGRALVVGEALASGIPVLASDASGWNDVIEEQSGRVFPAGDEHALIDFLRWFSENRDKLPAMKSAARAKAETCSWSHYRNCVTEAVAPFV